MKNRRCSKLDYWGYIFLPRLLAAVFYCALAGILSKPGHSGAEGPPFREMWRKRVKFPRRWPYGVMVIQWRSALIVFRPDFYIDKYITKGISKTSRNWRQVPVNVLSNESVYLFCFLEITCPTLIHAYQLYLCHLSPPDMIEKPDRR